ncbi:MAG: hypothetical protein ACRD08_10630, partial [Acidimicrobiales bacterium]
ARIEADRGAPSPAGLGQGVLALQRYQDWCRRALAENHRVTVAAHLARGDRAAARRAMDVCLEQLDDLGVPPTEDTEIVLRAIA